MRWDQGRFAIERACTCRPGNRFGECSARGYHVVDSGPDALDLLKEADRLQRENRVSYRVTDQATGEVIA